ncbi:MAG: cell division protein FtsX [Micrococcales bacterium 70-64]|nr:ABC transporter permease [Leifsonia sp.]ODU65659.1 MAG: cell division protein FtsX [Leifsonia sp. SCN 70-46]OJX84286.1 MAG: cell division protein FtsX [Micrococcales bacterium 70-64]
MTGFIGALVEAWAEIRIHRTRVLLSLIGVAVAVAALTSVVGLGAITQQATTESYERQSGRPATLFVSAYNVATGQTPDAKTFSTAFTEVTERYSVDWTTRSTYTQVSVDFVDGVTPVDTTLVDVGYGTMHRVQLVQGSWFVDGDDQRLAPALVVNETVWKKLGSPDLRTHPTVTLRGSSDVTAVIVGVAPDMPYAQDYPTMFMLYDSFVGIATPQQVQQMYPQFEAWVPVDISQELTELIKRDIAGELGEGWQVDVSRQDYLVYQGDDPLLPIKLLVGGVAVLVLLLGALGLVNISLVTVRQRIREIGIRRSFGATAGRVFFAVMMESVVAAAAAGVVGVFIAVVVVKNPTVVEFIAPGISDIPAFPLEAALIGLGSATFVGALAGLLPALVAVRVKVIDAIRY